VEERAADPEPVRRVDQVRVVEDRALELEWAQVTVQVGQAPPPVTHREVGALTMPQSRAAETADGRNIVMSRNRFTRVHWVPIRWYIN
jgi:hypothetical protein